MNHVGTKGQHRVDTLRKVFFMTVASLVIWLMVAMVDAATGSSEFATNAAAIIAFLCTMSIWLVWGLAQIDQLRGDESEEETEKAKRTAAGTDDARIALLLSLLDDDQRQALQQRLVEDLSADGEAVPLADLLAEQDTSARRSGG